MPRRTSAPSALFRDGAAQLCPAPKRIDRSVGSGPETASASDVQLPNSRQPSSGSARHGCPPSQIRSSSIRHAASSPVCDIASTRRRCGNAAIGVRARDAISSTASSRAKQGKYLDYGCGQHGTELAPLTTSTSRAFSASRLSIVATKSRGRRGRHNGQPCAMQAGRPDDPASGMGRSCE